MSRARYTVEDADELLGTLVPLLEGLRDAHLAMDERHDAVMNSVPTNGGGQVHKEYMDAMRVAERARETLEELAIVLRDPMTGLIDFPAERDGEEVFLCWRLGEERVAWWHSIDSGFAGREPL